MATDTDDADRSIDVREIDVREIDVREIDGAPFGDIVAALAELPEDGTLVLWSDFEPRPLYGVLAERGFDYEATRTGPDEWRVDIERA